MIQLILIFYANFLFKLKNIYKKVNKNKIIKI